MKTPFLGGETISASLNLVNNRLVNLYPEVLDRKDGKAVGAFLRCPGLTLWKTIGSGPIRGMRVGSNGVLYVVSGSVLWSITQAKVATQLGTVDYGSDPVRFADNGQQLLVVTSTGAWCLVYDGNAFTQVLPGDLSMVPGPVCYQDGFALVSASGTNQFFQSNLNDFTTWDALNYSSADSTSYPIVGMYDLHREAWLFKEDVIEVWINNGTSPFAFGRLQGVQIPVGCAAKNSISHISDGILWLGADGQGGPVVYISDGYHARRISTHGIEHAMNGFPTVSDAIGFCYQDRGHYFYTLTFPAADRTFVFDMSTQLWHERASFSNGKLHRHAANCHAFFGDHLVGDFGSGNIYRLDSENYTDNGNIQKWLRSWRALPPNQSVTKPIRFNALYIDAQTGIGIPDGTTPQMMLRWCDDGHNWSSEMWADSNQTGQTGSRVMFRRLGQTKRGSGLDRVFELSGVDPIPIALIGADMDAS